MDILNLSALLMSIVTLIIVFLKSIRKCKCSTAGCLIERRDDTGLEEQNNFVLQLLKILKSITPRRYITGTDVENSGTDIVRQRGPDIEHGISHSQTYMDNPADMIESNISNSIPKLAIKIPNISITDIAELNSTLTNNVQSIDTTDDKIQSVDNKTDMISKNIKICVKPLKRNSFDHVI